MQNELTQGELKEILDYDPETGVFIWRVRPCRTVCIGDTAGSLRDGYILIRYRGNRYYAHRLAWFYSYREFPKGNIDHINGVRSDNRICNLRDVTQRENLQNMKCHRDGHLAGTRYRKSLCKWVAQITLDRRSIHLGHFNTEEEAHAAYLLALANLGNPEYFEQLAKRKEAKGCSYHKHSGTWQACYRGKYLGYYKTAEEAHEAYLKAKEKANET